MGRLRETLIAARAARRKADQHERMGSKTHCSCLYSTHGLVLHEPCTDLFNLQTEAERLEAEVDRLLDEG